MQHQYPHAQDELWTMDEHRIGLKPILRRVWAPKGATVKAPVAQRYEWMYVFAFVHPQSGQTCWLLLPSVNIEIFSRALAAFAQEVGAGPDTPIVLVLDRAGWHSSARLKLPEGIHLVFLPPHSPEVQPAERLWPLSNEPLAASTPRGGPGSDLLRVVACPRGQFVNGFHINAYSVENVTQLEQALTSHYEEIVVDRLFEGKTERTGIFEEQ